jgi:hypothetical protein
MGVWQPAVGVDMTKRWGNWWGWQPIDTAPHDEDVSLLVTDGPGLPYTLKSQFRLTDQGWVHSVLGSKLVVTPLKWRKSPNPMTRDTEVRN